MPAEELLDVIKGLPVFQPFCFLPYCEFKEGLCDCEVRTSSALCSKKVIGPFFPFVPWILSCLLRPFKKYDHIFFSDTTLIYYSTLGNFGICGWNINTVGPCRTQDEFSVAWAPILSMEGQNLDLESNGSETCCRRLCRGNIIGRVLCPIGKSYFELGVDMGPYTYVVAGKKKNHNFNKDADILKGLAGLNRIQIQVDEWGKTKAYGDRNKYNA